MNKTFPKIIVLTSIFFVIINYFWYLINADDETKTQKSSNIDTFKSQEIETISNVWVAISTNLWTRFKQKSDTPVTAYKDVVDIWYIIANENIAQDAIITNHMTYLNEYLNILQSDIKWIISTSTDRAFALNAFLAQLNYRLTQAKLNVNVLNLQKNDLLNYLNDSNNNIDTIKNKISWDFANFNNKATLDNIEEFLKLKQENTSVRTYIIFIDRILWNYQILNNYNTKLLWVLNKNKDIIIKNSYIVLPNSWGEILQDLNVLYSEKEWNSLNK